MLPKYHQPVLSTGDNLTKYSVSKDKNTDSPPKRERVHDLVHHVHPAALSRMRTSADTENSDIFLF